jgi:hypothetical protein
MTHSLTYWQENRAAAHWMATDAMEHGDGQAAIYWQEYAAYCHRCYLCNEEMLARG